MVISALTEIDKLERQPNPYLLFLVVFSRPEFC